jgi:serine/threonine protein kinase
MAWLGFLEGEGKEGRERTKSFDNSFETSNHKYKVDVSDKVAGEGRGGSKLLMGTATLLAGGTKSVQVVVKNVSTVDPGQLDAYRDLQRELEVLRTCCKEKHPHLPEYIGSEEKGGFLKVVIGHGPSDLAALWGLPADDPKRQCRPQHPRLALQVIIAVLKALEVLHDKGFVHCDVQPKNVLVDVSSGVPQVTLIDFGACLRKEEEASKTRTWEYAPTFLQYEIVTFGQVLCARAVEQRKSRRKYRRFWSRGAAVLPLDWPHSTQS